MIDSGVFLLNCDFKRTKKNNFVLQQRWSELFFFHISQKDPSNSWHHTHTKKSVRRTQDCFWKLISTTLPYIYKSLSYTHTDYFEKIHKLKYKTQRIFYTRHIVNTKHSYLETAFALQIDGAQKSGSDRRLGTKFLAAFDSALPFFFFFFL